MNESSRGTFRSSPADGTENYFRDWHTHSPRHPIRGKTSRLVAHELAADNGKIDRDAVIYPARWPDTGDLHRIDASAPPPHGKLNYNNGSKDVQADKPVRNLSKDKYDDQDAGRRLDSMAIFGNAEMMGPRGAVTP